MGLHFRNKDQSLGRWSGTLTVAQPDPVFYTDFSEYSTGNTPSDWTVRFDAFPSEYTVIELPESGFGGKVLEFSTVGADPQRGISWDQLDIPNNKNVEIEMRTMGLTVINSSAASDMRCMIRGSGPTANDRTLYNHGLRFNSGGVVRAARIVNDSFTSLPGDNTSITAIENVWYMQKIRQEGPNYYIKVWLDSDPEPENWTIENVDPSELDQDGWIGISGISTGDHYVDFFRVTILG